MQADDAGALAGLGQETADAQPGAGVDLDQPVGHVTDGDGLDPKVDATVDAGFGQDGFVGEHAFHHRNARQVVAQRLSLREDGGQLQMISGRSGGFRMIIGRGWHR